MKIIKSAENNRAYFSFIAISNPSRRKCPSSISPASLINFSEPDSIE